MSRLFVIGDSYSTPYICVDPRDSFWGLSAKQIGVDEIVNASRPVNSFDSVCQLLIGMQNEYNYDWKNDWFLIGVPPLERVTVFDNHKNTAYKSLLINCENWHEVDSTMQCHNGLISKQFYGGDKFLTVHADRSWTETQLLREIYLLTQWLDSKNAKYLICNLSKPLDKENWWGPSETVLKHALEHPRCILFDNTYYSVNVGINLPPDSEHAEHWSGHHGPEGNKRYYEMSLKSKLQGILNNT